MVKNRFVLLLYYMDYTTPYISAYLDIYYMEALLHFVLQKCLCVYGQVYMPIIVQHKQAMDLVEMIDPVDGDLQKSYICAEI